jgi:hypothetical protein
MLIFGFYNNYPMAGAYAYRWNIMYEYEYVKINIPFFRPSKILFDYHDIVTEYADNGWRLVQIMPLLSRTLRIGKSIELIFEREK